MAGYNYEVCDLPTEEPHSAAFSNRLHVGERAPSFEVEDVSSREPVSMRSLWAQGPAVIEFGSFT